jgi:hypothetical protein
MFRSRKWVIRQRKRSIGQKDRNQTFRNEQFCCLIHKFVVDIKEKTIKTPMKKLSLLIQLLLISFTFTRAGESLLTKECDIELIPQIFVEGHSWLDFPNYEDRKFWNNIAPDLRGTIIERGLAASKTPPVTLTGYDYLLFKQGESFDIVSQKILSKKTRLEDLMIAEIIEGQGRFIGEISNSVWDFCALSNWTGPESQFIQTGQLGLPSFDKVVVDELTGEIAGVLSWAYYFFEKEFNKIDPNITSWIISSVRTKFLTPNLQKYDLYWMCYQSNGASYQTPWISYNWLLANLLIEKNNEQRKKSVYKAMECLDQFYKQMPDDGACSGGADIWQYSVGKYFQSLELLEMASVGEIDIYNDELLKNMGEYICAAHINDNYYFNYSDCSPKLTLPASLIYRFGKKVESEPLKGFGSSIAKEISAKNTPPTGDLFNKLSYIIDYSEMISYSGTEQLLADYFMKDSQIAIARTKSGTNEGFFFGVKGGHNDEFGNQNDAGNFILYANGKPLVVDPGGLAKTSKSINNQRYSVWANQSAWHNLPTVNGKMQNNGANHRATGIQYAATANNVTVSMNLAYAYELSAGIDDWTRTYTFDRNNGLVISDRFKLTKVDGDTYMSFIVSTKPQIKKSGVISLSIEGDEYQFEFKSSDFTVEVNEIPVAKDQQLKAWGGNLYRIVLKPTRIEKSDTWVYAFKKV